jgi:predicted NUDIX family NTP pyrophosphohydrolase
MFEDYGKVSAGILLYKDNKVFLVHLGGPKFANKDKGFWGIPKGMVEEGEDIKETALREFQEETGINLNINKDELSELGKIKTARGKIVRAFVLEGTGKEQFINSNMCTTEWPMGSGNIIEIPEVDKGEWFTIDEAYEKINIRQQEFLRNLTEYKKDQ